MNAAPLFVVVIEARFPAPSNPFVVTNEPGNVVDWMLPAAFAASYVKLQVLPPGSVTLVTSPRFGTEP